MSSQRNNFRLPGGLAPQQVQHKKLLFGFITLSET